MCAGFTFIRRHPGPTLALAIFSLFCIIYLSAAGNGFGYYRHLAAAIIAGRFDVDSNLIDPLHLRDFSSFNGRYFYPMGILPALVLVPAVAVFGMEFPQAALVLVLTAAIGLLSYRIARRLQFSERDALWVVLVVLVGSPLSYLVLRGTVFDTYLTHLLSLACLLSALTEYLGQRRWFAMGTLVGLSALARPLTIFAALFFIVLAWRGNYRVRSRVQSITAIALPIAAAALTIAAYNWLRFGNPLEAGYTYQLINPEVVAARQIGLFSLRHFPINFYRAFLAGPVLFLTQTSQNIPKFPYLTFPGKGMSLLLTFPLLLLAWQLNIRRPEVRWGLATAVAIALLNLFSFASGEHQYGYRYGFDFLPFLLFPLLASWEGKLSRAGRALIVGGIIFNTYLTLPALLNFPGAGT